MKKGFVCYMDILGFKEIIKNDNDVSKLYDVYNRYSSCKIKNSSTKLLFFSDSIILYTTIVDEKSLQDIIKKASNLFYDLLSNEIFVRGCLSFGNIVVKKNNFGTLITGDSIIDAYLIEEKLNWIGILISPKLIKNFYLFSNVLNFFNSVKIDLLPSYIQKYDSIPIYNNDKTDSKIEGYAIFPIKDSENQNTNLLNSLIFSLEKNKLFSLDKINQNKFDNTILFFSKILSENYKNNFPDDSY